MNDNDDNDTNVIHTQMKLRTYSTNQGRSCAITMLAAQGYTLFIKHGGHGDVLRLSYDVDCVLRAQNKIKIITL